MKKLLILSFIIFTSITTYAQSFKSKLDGAKKVVFVVTNSDLWIEAYDGGELVIEASGYEKPPKRAEGLRPMYNSVQDNTGIGLYIHKEGDVLKVVRASSRRNTDYKIKLPKRIDVVIEEANWQGGDFNVDGMEGEVEIKAKNADLFLKNVSGPIVAHSTSGNIQVVYTNIAPDKPSAITATSGYVDVTLPKNAKVDITLKAISGEIYTDFDVVMEKKMKDSKHNDGDDKNHKHDDCYRCDYDWGRGSIKGKINGGGVTLTLKAISGDIYLRKAK